MTQDTTISKAEGLWINDPETGRGDDPAAHFARIDLNIFGRDMRHGIKPEDAWRDLETRKRYIAYLKEHKSPLAEG